jgi:GNAT superfamily N-acetyltransferase
MEGIHIRRGVAEDVAVIHALLCALEKALGAERSVKRTEEDLRRFGFGESPRFKTLVAWYGDDPVGLALFFPEFSSWRGSPGVYVQDLYVSEKLRGAGLGRELMEAVYAEAHRWGDNEAAVKFYQQLGFRVSEDERVLVLDML